MRTRLPSFSSSARLTSFWPHSGEVHKVRGALPTDVTRHLWTQNGPAGRAGSAVAPIEIVRERAGRLNGSLALHPPRAPGCLAITGATLLHAEAWAISAQYAIIPQFI